MSNMEEKDKAPAEELAEIVTDALLGEGLILETDVSNTSREIASGQLKAEDWRLLLEKALDNEA
jgi:hypothetical protein